MKKTQKTKKRSRTPKHDKLGRDPFKDGGKPKPSSRARANPKQDSFLKGVIDRAQSCAIHQVSRVLSRFLG